MASLFFYGATVLLVSSAIFTTVQAADIQASTSTEEQKIYTRKEAYRASTNRIVLHYGEGVKGAKQIKEILIEEGYPAMAYPGGPEGKIELFINRRVIGTYDQNSVDNGELGGHAITFFKERVMNRS